MSQVGAEANFPPPYAAFDQQLVDVNGPTQPRLSTQTQAQPVERHPSAVNLALPQSQDEEQDTSPAPFKPSQAALNRFVYIATDSTNIEASIVLDPSIRPPPNLVIPTKISSGPLKNEHFPPPGKGYNSAACIYSAYGCITSKFWLKAERGREAGRSVLNIASNSTCNVTLAKIDPRQHVDLTIRSWSKNAIIRLPTTFTSSLNFRIPNGTLKASPKMKDRVTVYHQESTGGVGKIISKDEASAMASPLAGTHTHRPSTSYTSSSSSSNTNITRSQPQYSTTSTTIKTGISTSAPTSSPSSSTSNGHYRTPTFSFSNLLDNTLTPATATDFLPSFLTSPSTTNSSSWSYEKSQPIALSTTGPSTCSSTIPIEDKPLPEPAPNRYGPEFLEAGNTIHVRVDHGDVEIYEVSEEEGDATECVIC